MAQLRIGDEIVNISRDDPRMMLLPGRHIFGPLTDGEYARFYTLASKLKTCVEIMQKILPSKEIDALLANVTETAEALRSKKYDAGPDACTKIITHYNDSLEAIINARLK